MEKYYVVKHFSDALVSDFNDHVARGRYLEPGEIIELPDSVARWNEEKGFIVKLSSRAPVVEPTEAPEKKRRGR